MLALCVLRGTGDSLAAFRNKGSGICNSHCSHRSDTDVICVKLLKGVLCLYLEFKLYFKWNFGVAEQTKVLSFILLENK